jgi:UDP-3-O-[3-hydroxymyristoyl] glucosamine N-acyltransferase
MGADPRFHPGPGALPLAAIAAAAGAETPADGARLFTGVAPLGSAGAGEVAFCEGRRHRAALAATGAGCVLVSAAEAAHVPASALALIVRSPWHGFAAVARLFHPVPAPRPGVHPSAVVAPDAEIGEGCEIGPLAVIGAGASIGAGSSIGAGCVIGPACVLGAGCVVHPHVSVSHALIGARVVLHPGARIGQEGFGFAPGPDGRFVTMPQLGRVILGDEVEVGANACVDRGAGQDTVIGTGTRIDNLVQVAHNVTIGAGSVIVALAGISGSASLGARVTVAGQAGVAGHHTVGDGARIGAQAGVMNDVPAGADVVGSPAWPARETFRAVAALRRLAQKRAEGAGGEG